MGMPRKNDARACLGWEASRNWDVGHIIGKAAAMRWRCALHGGKDRDYGLGGFRVTEILLEARRDASYQTFFGESVDCYAFVEGATSAWEAGQWALQGRTIREPSWIRKLREKQVLTVSSVKLMR